MITILVHNLLLSTLLFVQEPERATKLYRNDVVRVVTWSGNKPRLNTLNLPTPNRCTSVYWHENKIQISSLDQYGVLLDEYAGSCQQTGFNVS